MQFSCLMRSALALAGLALSPAAADAALYHATLTGTLSYGSDNLYLFGGGILPKNTPWSMAFTYDDGAPGAVISTAATIEPSSQGSGLSATSAGVIDATFTWGGITYDFGSKGGEIRREHSAGYGAANFFANGSNTGANDAWIVVTLAQYSPFTALDSTDFRAPLDIVNPPAWLARFEAVNYTPGIFTRTSFALNVASVKVEPLAGSSPTPEPASWAMMVAGFVAVGTAMRGARGRASPAGGGATA